MKQLVILVCYYNVHTMSELRRTEALIFLKKLLRETFTQELQDETNTTIRTIVLAVQDQPTQIECIFPAEPDLPQEIIEKLEQIELTQKEYDTNRPKD